MPLSEGGSDHAAEGGTPDRPPSGGATFVVRTHGDRFGSLAKSPLW
jgi:hypothetical protein